MPDFTYTTGVPNPPNNPSADVGSMQTNTNSISALIAIDHVGFNGTLGVGGKHQQVQIQNQSSIPSSLTGGQSTIYSKGSGGAQLFYTPGVSGNEYQLTRGNTTNFGTFGNITGAQNSGWTFLPGGLLLQYGNTTAVSSSSSTTVTFPFPFTTAVFTVQATVVTNDNSTIRFSLLGTAGLTSFTTTQTSTAHFTNLYWIAIGI